MCCVVLTWPLRASTAEIPTTSINVKDWTESEVLLSHLAAGLEHLAGRFAPLRL